MSDRFEIHRRVYYNQLNDDFAQTKRTIKLTEQTIDRLNHDTQPFSVTAMLLKAETKLSSLTILLVEQEQKLSDILAGGYDTTIKAEMDENKEEIKRKTTATKKKKDDKKVPMAGWKTEKKGPRIWTPVKYANQYVAKETDRFFRDCSSFPPNLQDQLARLPNNSGFLWRGIWHLGARDPVEPLDVVTLRDRRDGQLVIHTFKDGEHTVRAAHDRGPPRGSATRPQRSEQGARSERTPRPTGQQGVRSDRAPRPTGQQSTNKQQRGGSGKGK